MVPPEFNMAGDPGIVEKTPDPFGKLNESGPMGKPNPRRQKTWLVPPM